MFCLYILFVVSFFFSFLFFSFPFLLSQDPLFPGDASKYALYGEDVIIADLQGLRPLCVTFLQVWTQARFERDL